MTDILTDVLGPNLTCGPISEPEDRSCEGGVGRCPPTRRTAHRERHVLIRGLHRLELVVVDAGPR
jgi:hypothetical protein